MKPYNNNGSGRLIALKTLSDNPHAKSQRVRRLLDEDYNQRFNVAYSAYRRRKRIASITKKSNSHLGNFPETFLARIRHHLSKGRDAADIAIRERWMVSRVMSGIEAVKATPPEGLNGQAQIH